MAGFSPLSRPTDFHQLPAVRVTLRADAAGRLAAILFNEHPLRDAAELRRRSKAFAARRPAPPLRRIWTATAICGTAIRGRRLPPFPTALPRTGGRSYRWSIASSSCPPGWKARIRSLRIRGKERSLCPTPSKPAATRPTNTTGLKCRLTTEASFSTARYSRWRAAASVTTESVLILLVILGTSLKALLAAPSVLDLKLRIKPTGFRTYPDVSVYCGKPELDPDDPARQTYVNPTMLAEVLSPSTEQYDRADKVGPLPAHRVAEDHFARVPGRGPRRDACASARWKLEPAGLRGHGPVLSLEAIGVELPLMAIYQGVDFTSDE